MAHHPGALAWARRWAREGQTRWRSCFRSAIACRRPDHARISRAAASERFGKYSRLANSTISSSSTNCCLGWCIGLTWNWQPQRSNPVRSVVGEQRSQLQQEHYDRIGLERVTRDPLAVRGRHVWRRVAASAVATSGADEQRVALLEPLSSAHGLGRALRTSVKSPLLVSAFGMIQRRCFCCAGSVETYCLPSGCMSCEAERYIRTYASTRMLAFCGFFFHPAGRKKNPQKT
jgi:hypothetical protein